MSKFIIILSSSLIDNPISELGLINNAGFIIFLCCFLLIVFVLGKEPHLIKYVLEELFKRKEKSNLFTESLSHTLSYKLLLSLQNTIISTLFIYVIAKHYSYINDLSLQFFFEFSINAFILVFIFFLYKIATTNIIGYVFFQKEQINQWNENFYSILSLSGLCLFFPILLAFYDGAFFSFGLYFSLFILFFSFLLLNYRTYITFFQQKNSLLNFILYLCAQEIIPIYIIYKGIIYLFSIAQKDSLWIQL